MAAVLGSDGERSKQEHCGTFDPFFVVAKLVHNIHPNLLCHSNHNHHISPQGEFTLAT